MAAIRSISAGRARAARGTETQPTEALHCHAGVVDYKINAAAVQLLQVVTERLEAFTDGDI